MEKEIDEFHPEAFVLISANRKRSGCPGKIVDIVGGYGPWQLLHWFIFCSVVICSSWHTLSIAFIAPYSKCWCVSRDSSNSTAFENTDRNVSSVAWADTVVNHRCYLEKGSFLNCGTWNVSDDVKSCGVEGRDDTGIYSSTIVTEWSLFCDQRWYTSFARSVYMIAAFLSVPLSDNIGKRFCLRSVCLAGYLLFFVCSVLTSFAPSFGVFTVLRFFSALGLSSLQWITFIALSQSVAPEYRSLFIACSYFGWIIGYMLLPAFAWFSSSWTTLQLIISVPCVILAIPVSVLPESWNILLLHGKPLEAEKVLRRAINMNGMNCDGTKELIQELHMSLVKSRANSSTFYEDLKIKAHIKNIWFYSCSFLVSLLYYVLTWYSHHFYGDAYANFSMAGSMEVLSVFIVMFFGICVQPKIALSISVGVTSVILLFGANMPRDGIFLPLSSFLAAKTAITCACLLIFIHGTGPWNISSSGKCENVLFAAFFYLGAAVSPILDDPIANGQGWIPITVISSLSLTCCLFAPFLLASEDEQSCQVQPDPA